MTDLITRLRGGGEPWTFAEIIEALEAGRESALWLDRTGQAYDTVVKAIPDEFILVPPDGGAVPAEEAVAKMAAEIVRLRAAVKPFARYGKPHHFHKLPPETRVSLVVEPHIVWLEDAVKVGDFAAANDAIEGNP